METPPVDVDPPVDLYCLFNRTFYQFGPLGFLHKMSALGPRGEMLPRNSPDYGQGYSEYSSKHSPQGPYVVHGGHLTDSGGESFVPVRKTSPGSKGESASLMQSSSSSSSWS